MSLKVMLGEVKPHQQKPFPKLMKNIDNGCIYFFHRERVGLPLQEPDREPASESWPSHWLMEYFEDYNEPITLQNA